MTNRQKEKVEHRFSPAEAADYLRQLADGLEKGHIILGSGELELEGEVKVKQEFQAKSGLAALKVKLKITAPPTSEEQVAGEPAALHVREETLLTPGGEQASFLGAKKALGKTFGNLRTLRKGGGLPSSSDVAPFAAQGRLMCASGLSGQGSEFFPRFLAALEQLESAAAKADPQAVDAALGVLAQYKSECHRKFK